MFIKHKQNVLKHLAIVHVAVHIIVLVYNQNMVSDQRMLSFQHGPTETFHCYDLFLIFKEFREQKQYKELITFLVTHYPANVKNKTFNFVNSNHLFHSLYAYIPAVTNVEKERKQIRLSEECIYKLFINTINDFKLYSELFDMIRNNKMEEECPCQLLLQRKNEIKAYVNTINEKKFDNKPPKLKKETIDNIMYKYSLNWKNILLKRKTFETKCQHVKKKRKIKKRTILTDDYIYKGNLNNFDKLNAINGMTLNICQHEYITVEQQLRAGDEAVSFIKYCRRCAQMAKN
ncbi:late expression factor 5 [Ectropis obliqua nucleopolyhedrovirus]|uniref:Late expression factor 5 n=1 Tax=Ectropis obliqua nucleopolyhedrovirus TaxID=59376 RepID=A0EYY1_9ABAC|nr:late expression factor 5 [Ectropis obliqua nucleopolyhedrovirus]ABI35761.1 late expression factor 5 [Ectropis obliqua nucleopolyhedrovirus]AGS47931.1 late expression factor 5 [Ectropis obliqua nucleopolyhedrovirus]QWV59653.1 late expression factor 5 [Ectropis obliqua nucleopolyhedrovirus]UYO72876.1 late expression factor 5 [Ectropis obliqua nucleopolyhedrovirus]